MYKYLINILSKNYRYKYWLINYIYIKKNIKLDVKIAKLIASSNKY